MSLYRMHVKKPLDYPTGMTITLLQRNRGNYLGFVFRVGLLWLGISKNQKFAQASIYTSFKNKSLKIVALH